MDLSINQRSAIKQMLSGFYAQFKMGRWDERLLKFFSDYNLPVRELSLSPYAYYNELRLLPLSIKRDIIHRVFNAWKVICDYHKLSLREAFTTLIYLKICSGPEYFLMNEILAFLSYFGTDDMWSDSYEPHHYELNYGDSNNSVQFNVSEGSDRLQIMINGSLVNQKFPFDLQPTKEQIQPLFDVINSQPLKTHFRWIEADYDLGCRYSNYGFDKGLLEFNLNNIEFADYNGVG